MSRPFADSPERPANESLSPPLPGISHVALVAGVTAGVWAAYFAARVAHALLDDGATAHTAYLIVALSLASGAGAALCLGIGYGLARMGGLSLAVRLFGGIAMCNFAALAWTTVNRLAIFPLVLTGFAALGWTDASFDAPRALSHESTFTIWLVFLAWAGLRLAITPPEGPARATPAPAFETELWAGAGRGLARVRLVELLWIEAERDYVRLHLTDGRPAPLLRQTLQALAERLDPERFIRIHRSHVVSRDGIARIERRGEKGLTVVLTNGARLPVGRTHEPALRALRARPA